MYWRVVYEVPRGGKMVELLPTEEILKISPSAWYLALIEILSYIIEAALAVAFMVAMIKEAVEVIKGELSS